MGDQVLSSLPLQVLLYFNAAFSVLFVVISVATFIYKGNQFLYSEGVLGTEVFFLFVYVLLEWVRLFQASKGNKIEQVGPLLWSLLFAVAVVVIHVFYFEMQTFVLKIDRIINGMGMTFIGLELLFMLLAALSFYRDSKI